MIQRVVIRYGQLIWPDSINVIFQFTSSENFYLEEGGTTLARGSENFMI